MLSTESARLPNVSEFYGAKHVAAAYCGLKQLPSYLTGHWQHGWSPAHTMIHPCLVFQFDADGRFDDYFWVARKEEEHYLRQHGYRNARAIGLPVVYLPQRPILRKRGSLLVMTAHSHPTMDVQWNCERYAEEISQIRHDFAEVAVRIHPHCWQHGYWKDAFQKRGFHLIPPEENEDLTILSRMQHLLSTYEYVTTNRTGSHVAYAAFFGAKVSFYGTYEETRVEELNKDSFVRKYTLSLEFPLVGEKLIRQHFSELFCHPREAPLRQEWGRFQVGYDNKVSPREMRRLFRWRAWDLALFRLRSSIPEPIKHCARYILRSDYRRRCRESGPAGIVS